MEPRSFHHPPGLLPALRSSNGPCAPLFFGTTLMGCGGSPRRSFKHHLVGVFGFRVSPLIGASCFIFLRLGGRRFKGPFFVPWIPVSHFFFGSPFLTNSDFKGSSFRSPFSSYRLWRQGFLSWLFQLNRVVEPSKPRPLYGVSRSVNTRVLPISFCG